MGTSGACRETFAVRTEPHLSAVHCGATRRATRRLRQATGVPGSPPALCAVHVRPEFVEGLNALLEAEDDEEVISKLPVTCEEG